jgi:hypothetical protein
MKRWIVAVAIGMAALPACRSSSGDHQTLEPPARVETVAGSAFHQVTLSARASERLDIHTDKVVADPANPSKLIVPYAAVLYDANGEASAYTNPTSRTFVRARITIDRVDVDRAFLSAGPPAGTDVVTVGAAELLGVESGVGEG